MTDTRHERVGGACMDCGGIKWPCPTEVRRLGLSAQPDGPGSYPLMLLVPRGGR